MAMSLRNNLAANYALSQTAKNEKARSKSHSKISSGMKINSAADDSSGFSISSRMRVKLRALEQDSQNVQNGTAILNTAEGGIQNQIDLLRTIREKVIDAANDHNTDEDRQTIQKEINQLYDEMEQIAYGTDFNSKKPLIGDVVFSVKAVGEDTVYGSVKKLANSDLNIIPDNYDTLDGVKGPFDIFKEWKSPTVVSTEQMTGYDEGKYEIVSADFSAYTDVSQLNDVGILVTGVYERYGNYYTSNSRYVFTDHEGNYAGVDNTNEISISAPVNSVEAALDKLARAMTGYYKGVQKVERDGLKLKVTTYNNSGENKADIVGISDAGGANHTTVTHTDGKGVGGTYYTSGGVNNPIDNDDPNKGAKATLTVNLSSAAHDSGFKFDSSNFRIVDYDDTATTNKKGVINRAVRPRPLGLGI